jgi:hypothetical protein
MKKLLAISVIALFIVLTPYLTVKVIERYKVKPEVVEETIELPESKPEINPQPLITEPKKEEKKKESANPEFIRGYWDGWDGKRLPIIRWTTNEDYRQGHMLGTYDHKHKIERYERPKSQSKKD